MLNSRFGTRKSLEGGRLLLHQLYEAVKRASVGQCFQFFGSLENKFQIPKNTLTTLERMVNSKTKTPKHLRSKSKSKVASASLSPLKPKLKKSEKSRRRKKIR